MIKELIIPLYGKNCLVIKGAGWLAFPFLSIIPDLDLKVQMHQDSEMNYSLIIFPPHRQNGFNYIMVALNVIMKGIQSLESRLSENHDKLFKTAEIAHL